MLYAYHSVDSIPAWLTIQEFCLLTNSIDPPSAAITPLRHSKTLTLLMYEYTKIGDSLE